MAKNVLVTGGAGYIGSHACKALVAQGFHPVVFDNLSLGHRYAVKWGPLVKGDLLDRNAIIDAIRTYQIEAVIHFAGSAYVGDSVKDPSAYYVNNLLTTLTLLDAMRGCDVDTLIFSSSCSVYGNPSILPIDEEHSCRPLSPYGQTKLDCENAIRWYAGAYGLRWIALRYFNAAGADEAAEIGEDHDPETRLVPRAILAAMGQGDALDVYGDDYDTADGTAIRDYIHVSDLARAHVLALQRLEGGLVPQVLNLGTGRGYSVLDVLEAVALVAGHPVPMRHAMRRPGDPAIVVADASRARGALGWKPECSTIEQIVRTAWRWHEKRLGLMAA